MLVWMDAGTACTGHAHQPSRTSKDGEVVLTSCPGGGTYTVPPKKGSDKETRVDKVDKRKEATVNAKQAEQVDVLGGWRGIHLPGGPLCHATWQCM